MDTPVLLKVATRPETDLKTIREDIERIRLWLDRVKKVGGLSSAEDSQSAITDALADYTQEYFPNYAVPPAPLNLAAAGTISAIMWTWDAPTYLGHAYTEFWRAETDDLGQAVLVGTARDPDSFFVDNTLPDTSIAKTYYGWIRFINKNGVEGPFNASSGTAGSTKDDPAYFLEILEGQILASHLASSLAEPIALIPSLSEAITSLEAQFTQLAGDVVGTVFFQDGEPVPGVGGIPDPIPDNSRWYDTNDNNHPYIWADLGSGYLWVDLADPRIAQNVADIAALSVSLTAAEGDIDANASAISSLDATVAQLGTDITAIAADITQLETDLTSLSGDVSANASAISGLDTRVTANENGLSSQATSITTLQTGLTNAEGDIEANAGAIVVLTAGVEQNGNDIALQSSQITQLSNDIGDNAAAILTEQTARTTADGALAQSIETLQSTVGDNTTSIQTQQTTLDGVSAQYVVKIDNNGFVTGFGLASEVVNGTPFSEFIARADRFAIINPNAAVINITSLTRSGATVTALCSAAHGLTTGMQTIISGAVPYDYNGLKLVTVTGSNTFTYPITTTPTTPATVQPGLTGIKAAKAVVPFIVQDGTTYMTTALVKDLTATNFVGGTITADSASVLFELVASKIIAGIISASGIYLGSSSRIHLDGANQRIIVSDGTRDRVWLGNLGAPGWGIRIWDAAGTLVMDSGGVSASMVSGLGAFALINQITSANISTYMQAAAIGEAYIGLASVSTLKIQDQAVIIPISSYTDGDITVGSTWVTIQTAYIAIPSDGGTVPVEIIGSVFLNRFVDIYGQATPDLEIRILRLSTEIQYQKVCRLGTISIINAYEGLPHGTTITYNLQARLASGGTTTVKQRYLSVKGIQK